MDQSSVVSLETQFGVRFPAAYRAALQSPDLDPASEELCIIKAELIRSNEALLQFAPPDLGWSQSHWWLGADGSGGFYFIDCNDPSSTVLYYDHEVPPESPNDIERLKPRSFDSFLASAQ